MALWKAKWGPLWIAIPVGVLSLGLYLRSPAERGFYGFLLVCCALMVGVHLFMAISKRVVPAEVPDYAVVDLLNRCEQATEGWILIEFEPTLTLDEARVRVGSGTYEQEDRKKLFMTKFKYVSSTPGVAFFFSSEKGYLMANRDATLVLLKKHGHWMLDTWRSLLGAARFHGLEARSLDGPQFVRIGHY